MNYSVAEFVYAHGTVAQVFEMRARDFMDKYSRLLAGGFPGFLSLFVLGLWVGRTGLVDQLSQRLPVIRRALIVALVCCIVGLFVEHNFGSWWPRPRGQAANLTEFLGRVPRGQTALIVSKLALWSMTAAYMCALTLLAHRRGWHRRLAFSDEGPEIQAVTTATLSPRACSG